MQLFRKKQNNTEQEGKKTHRRGGAFGKARRGFWGRVNGETGGSVATKGNGENAAPKDEPRRSRGYGGGSPHLDI